MIRCLRRALCVAAVSLGIVVSGQAADTKKPIKLAYVEWDCATATTYLAKAALEDHFGVRVEVMSVSAAALWAGVSSGDVDGMLAAWLPLTHKSYADSLRGKYEDLGPIVGGARLGLVVPSYVTISSITELNDNATKFRKQIIGIDPGAGIMSAAEETIKAYGLKNLRLIDGSGATMAAMLADAIRRHEWIVVTGWSPHWMFGRWDLKYLEDPKGTMGAEETIHSIVRLKLKEQRPEVYGFFDNFHYENLDQLQTLMAWNQEDGADLTVNARRFMKEHPDLVKSWFKQ